MIKSLPEKQVLWFENIGRQLFYRGVRLTARLVAVVTFGFRTEGQHHLEFEGGGMLLATHQSLLDPVLIGMVPNRRLNYLARCLQDGFTYKGIVTASSNGKNPQVQADFVVG